MSIDMTCGCVWRSRLIADSISELCVDSTACDSVECQ